jgi:IS5 family transposase
MPLSVILRIYLLQQWYSLSDPTAEEALYDMHSMRNFVGIDLAHDAIADETTILNCLGTALLFEIECIAIVKE